MPTLIAYLLVVPLVQFCLTTGVILGGFLVALLLAWSPTAFRTTVAGVAGGISGVAFALAFGYGIFRLLVGPDCFTVGPFLASTVPLLLPIRNDFLQSRRVKAARQQLLDTTREASGDAAISEVALDSMTAHGSGVVGEIAGLLMSTAWFFSR